MKSYYQNAIIIVTGGASGIGLSLCDALLKKGAKLVVMADIDEENLNRESAILVGKYPGRVEAHRADVSSQEQVEALIKRVSNKEGHLDFLFNNAGIGHHALYSTVTPSTWRRVLDVNFMSVVYGIHAALPVMRTHKRGHIVNTASVTGLFPAALEVVYGAAKAAMISMTVNLRMELAAEGVRFSVVCPGAVDTAILAGHPPADAISATQAAEIILDGVERNEHLIIFPEKWEKIYKQYVNDFPAFEGFMTREIKGGYAAAALRSDPVIREAATKVTTVDEFMRFSADHLRKDYSSIDEAKAEFAPFQKYVEDMAELNKNNH
jgi:NAD(P)-dependent dehydrogenase (short-subunit alcohol dehydrogenase family)